MRHLENARGGYDLKQCHYCFATPACQREPTEGGTQSPVLSPPPPLSPLMAWLGGSGGSTGPAHNPTGLAVNQEWSQLSPPPRPALRHPCFPTAGTVSSEEETHRAAWCVSLRSAIIHPETLSRSQVSSPVTLKTSLQWGKQTDKEHQLMTLEGQRAAEVLFFFNAIDFKRHFR